MDKEEARATSSASRAERDTTPSDAPILSRSRVLASTPGTGAAQRGLGVGNQRRRHGKSLRRMAENGTVTVKPFGAGGRARLDAAVLSHGQRAFNRQPTAIE